MQSRILTRFDEIPARFDEITSVREKVLTNQFGVFIISALYDLPRRSGVTGCGCAERKRSGASFRDAPVKVGPEQAA